MTRLYLLLASALPVTAMAHPDHSYGTYSLMHYFTGSHLIGALIGAVVLYGGYKLAKRFLTAE